MPEISEKLAAFLQGGGIGLSILTIIIGILKWLGERRDKRASEDSQHAHDDLSETRRRADAFGDEMYERWQSAQERSDKWRDAYTDLYYTGQGLLPHLANIPLSVVSIVQKILDAPSPRKVIEPEKKKTDE